jgi:hypothetical protein
MQCEKDEVEAYDRDTKKSLGVCVKATIGSVRGPAKYEGTEVEKHGKWSQDYWTRDGFYVLHHGEMHHIYHARPDRYPLSKVEREEALFNDPSKGQDPDWDKSEEELRWEVEREREEGRLD